MKRATAISLGVGALFFVFLLRHYGWSDVVTAVAAAGWGLVWISAYRFVTITTDAVGWQALFPAPAKPRLVLLVPVRWVGEAVNSLLPVAQVGGDVVRARLAARQGGHAIEAGAATIVDFTLGLLTQVAYTLVGVALLVRVGAGGRGLAGWLLIGSVAAVGVLGVFYLAQRGGMFGRGARILRRILGQNLHEMTDALHSSAQELDEEVGRIYARRWAVTLGTAWRFATWMLHTAETWLALRFMGAAVGWEEALILESLGTAIRSAAFVIPAGLGAQEGGLLLIASALGIPPPIALGLALVKRVRELLVGVPGLLAWAWMEHKGAMQEL